MLSADELKIVGLSGLACAHAGFYVHPIETAMVRVHTFIVQFLTFDNFLSTNADNLRKATHQVTLHRIWKLLTNRKLDEKHLDLVCILVKVQQQLLKKGTKLPPWPVMLGRLYKLDGLSGPFRGLSSSMLRELSFSALRVGLYEPIRNSLAKIGPSDSDAYRCVQNF